MNGFPNLLSGISGGSVLTGILGAVQGALWKALEGPTKWNIYNNGTTTSAFEFDSVVSMDQSKDTTLAEYKIETGGFVSYDKVQKPREISIRLTKSGSDADRKKMLVWLETETNAVSLFDIIVPEGIYPQMTLVQYKTSRSASSGGYVIIADCLFREVRLIPQTYASSTTGATTSTQTTAAAAAPAAKPPSLLQRVAAQIPGGQTLLKVAGKLGWQ